MAKAVLRFSNVSNPNYLIITWSLFATPLSEIGRQVYNTPHPPRSLTIDNLDPVMHRFSFWQSVDGTTLSTRLLDMDIDASINETEIIIYEYVVDRGSSGVNPTWSDPSVGETTITDQRLRNVKFNVERRGIGKLRPDEYSKNTAAGSFTLLNGSVFEEDDTYFAVAEKVVSQQTNPVPSSDYLDVIDVTTNSNFDVTMHRKLVDIKTSSSAAILAFPALSSIPKTKVLISTHSMTGRYVVLAFSGAETVSFLGQNMNKITLGKGEEIELLFTDNTCRVLRYSGSYRVLGQVNFGRGIELNTIPLDGALYNIADFPRLYNDFINRLPATQIKSMASWATSQAFGTVTEYPNKGFFAVDVTAGTFRVPDFRNRTVRAMKMDVSADATRFTDHPGGFQMDSVGPHTHVTKSGWWIFGSSKKGNLTASNSAVDGGDGNRTNDGLQNNTGTETITRNIGLIPQIII